MTRRAAALVAGPIALLLVGTLMTSCGSARNRIDGIVLEVTGTLTETDSFTLLTEDGERLVFDPAEGVLFHDQLPLSHLSDHVRSGEPISVEYRTEDDGTLVAIRVDDL